MWTLSSLAITGGRGFLGWHTSVRLRAIYRADPKHLGRRAFSSAADLETSLDDVDTIIHLAGINRAESEDAVETGNEELGLKLAQAVRSGGRPVHLVFGNSIQSRMDNAYGRGKAKASEVVREAVQEVGGTFVDVLLPNVFGEHGRPHYNSFVATFCHEISRGGRPEVSTDRAIPLLHAQGAAQALIDAATFREDGAVEPASEEHLVSDVLNKLFDFHDKYTLGQVPALLGKFEVDLFNTYRSFLFPQHFPFRANVNTDERGELFETVRSHGGSGQVFVSTTRPGETRGDHFHLSKIERFFVLSGTAEIALRRVYDDKVIRFRLEGSERAFVDMPTMWVHSLRNVGDDELVTLFWTDQLLDPRATDTYWEAVDLERVES